ncbi:MAG: alpha/beta hydrolase [Ruminococcaceae bacterium]|nr:alpha/beta hydrolase [Oscillospiraceae bacterium]
MLIALIFAAAVLLCGVVSFITYRMAFYANTKSSEISRKLPNTDQYNEVRETMLSYIDDLSARPYERVCIRSDDGKRLWARYYHSANGAPLDIGFHGYKSHPVRDFCGGSRISFAMGHNLLLPEQRAHAESDGRTITFGILERLDCLAWVNYALERFGEETPICLYGVSMGAATVLMAGGEALPRNVRAIIADCPYSSPVSIIGKVCREDMRLPFGLLHPFLRLGARLYGGFRLDPKCGAVEAVKRGDVPILILHGEDDRFVPCEMSREIQRANPERVRLKTFAGAGHGLSYLKAPDAYEAEVREFLQKVL